MADNEFCMIVVLTYVLGSELLEPSLITDTTSRLLMVIEYEVSDDFL